MTGVQLAEARTAAGGGDFVVPAAAAPAGPVSSITPTPSSSSGTSPAPVAAAAPSVGPSSGPSPDPAVPATTAPAGSSAPAAPPTTSADPAPSSAPATAEATPSPAPVAPPAAGIPTGFALPRLDVQAPIDPVGMTDGELQVPEDIKRLGWWTGSAAAGGPSGTTVIDGHIDSPQGRGVFYHLQEVQPDDQVVLSVAGGATVNYRVTERRSYHKADGLPPEVFATSDQPRLVLITCGGRYDFATASYDDNIVVIAAPS